MISVWLIDLGIGSNFWIRLERSARNGRLEGEFLVFTFYAHKITLGHKKINTYVQYIVH